MNDEPTEVWVHTIKIWKNKKGQLHRDGDLPAYINSEGTWWWYQNGKRHRDYDLPAYIDTDGNCEWYIKDKKIKEKQIFSQEKIKQYKKPCKEAKHIKMHIKTRCEMCGKDTRIIVEGEVVGSTQFCSRQCCRAFKQQLINLSTKQCKTKKTKKTSNKPTKIHKNGTKEWHNAKGQYHRDGDLPAIVNPNHSYWWYKNGQIHRSNNLPAVININGQCQWWIRNKFIKRGKCTPKQIEKYKRSLRNNKKGK